MNKDVVCPFCKELQKDVDLEETQGLFVCDACATTVHAIKVNTDGIVEVYSVYNLLAHRVLGTRIA